MPAAGYADNPTTKPPPWHALVVWDLLFNNLASGLFLVAATSELAAPSTFRRVANVIFPISLAFLAADLLCLVGDLGDPWRFHHMLRVFKPSSPMSLGTWCLTALSLPLAILAAIGVFGLDLPWLRTVAIVFGLLPAFGVAAYKGVLFSTSAQPGWKDARWLGAYLANSALTLGSAGCLTAAIALDQAIAVTVMRIALAPLLTFNFVISWLLIHGTNLSVGPLKVAARIGAFALAMALLAVGGTAALLIAAGIVLLVAIAVRFEIIDWPRTAANHG